MSLLAELAEWITDPELWMGSNGIPVRTLDHMWLAVLSTTIAAALALPPAVWLAHRRLFPFAANAIVNIGRAVPSFGIIVVAGLVAIRLGASLRFWPVVVALVALALPPIFTNAYTGIATVEPTIVEAARGMGLTERDILRKVELPIGAPVVLAGLRISFVQVIATVALGAIISSGGGLGQYIIKGFAQGEGGRAQVLGGAILVALVALLGEWLFTRLERRLLPGGVARLVRREDMLESATAR